MSDRLTAMARRLIESALALTPWLLSMYLLFWLDSTGIWNSETPHRGKLSVALLAAGMLGSFFLHSFLSKHRRS